MPVENPRSKRARRLSGTRSPMPDRPPQNVLADLGLAGDGDEHEMVRDLEAAFQVDFGDSFAGWTTVGDIEAALVPLFPASPSPGPCATTMAFYMLRRALFPLQKVSPKQKLATLRSRSAIRTLGMLERDLALRMPRAATSIVGVLGMAVIGLGICGGVPGAEYLHIWWVGPAAVVGGGILMGADRGSFEDKTLGDLARDIALLNYGSFAARGADRRPATIWHVLRHIVCRQTGVHPSGVERTTRILATSTSRRWLRPRRRA